jgi:hypothetical protein
VVERAINKLKGHRAVATRYDKRDYMFRGTVDVASIRIWLREIGRQRRSAARWILQVSPPRDRPKASRLGLVADFL